MNKITSYEIIRHGAEHSDYFQGCGVSYTSFNHVSTGIGDTEAEAFDDALESIAQSHSFVDGEIERIEKEHGQEWSEEDMQTVIGATDEEMEGNDQPPYWHVSIRYNIIPDNGLRAVEYTAPSCWASYLINGDSSGISDDDVSQCDAWVDSIGHGSPVSCEEAGFMHHHDARQFCPLAADCETYTFLYQDEDFATVKP